MRKSFYYSIVSVLFFIFVIVYQSVYYIDLFKILEESGIFLFTVDFFKEKIVQPGGGIYYLGDFFRQFYYFPYLGVTLVALLLSSIQLIVAKIFRLKGWKYVISFLPAVLLLCVCFEAAFQPELLLGVLIALLLLFGYTRNMRFRYRYGVTLFVLVVAYFLISAYAIYALGLIVLYDMLYEKGRKRFVFAVEALLLGVGVVFAASYLIFELYPVSLSFTGLKGGLFVSPGLYQNGILIASFATLPFVMLIARVLKGKAEKESVRTILWVGVLSLTGVAGVVVAMVSPQLSVLTDQVASDRAAMDEDWDNLLKMARQGDLSTEHQIQDINLAFCMKGVMGEQLFSVLQTSQERGMYSVFDEYSGLFAQKFSYHLGLYNMAYRWAYECNVSHGNAPRFLKRMLQVSVINGEYAIARKYARTLNETLFYSDFAKQYIDFMDGKGEPEIVEYMDRKRKDIPKQNTLICELFDFGEVMRTYVESNPENLPAYHYYLSYLLLKVDLQKFVEMLPLHYDEGVSLPRHYEEAVVLYNMNMLQSPVTRYKIAESKTKSFFDFIRKAENGGASSVKSFESSFWFYAMFIASK